MGIYDALQLCRADVSTIAFGLAASTAAIVLAGGSKGKRFAMPNARIMMHQPMGGASGQAIDVEIQAKEVMYHKNNITRILSEITGRPFKQVIALMHNLLGNYFAVECTTANMPVSELLFVMNRWRRTLTETAICHQSKQWNMDLLMV
jgi:ATP-dependent Clp endopeptidase proteolytic subunit ClpP